MFACFCNATANTLWKLQFDKNPFIIASLSDVIPTFFTLNIIGGVFAYICSMLMFFYLLSHYNLSAIIPLTCLTYIFNLIAAYMIFNERLNPNQLIGTAILIFGIWVFSR
jgi:drug/metabolite transporter (DMT)-like permease